MPPQAYFFRTFIRWTTGAAAWDHLNRTMSIAVAEREARSVVLRVFGLRLTRAAHRRRGLRERKRARVGGRGLHAIIFEARLCRRASFILNRKHKETTA